MNRFEDLLESLTKQTDKKFIDEIKGLDSTPIEKQPSKAVRMPYSSDPHPIDPAWD